MDNPTPTFQTPAILSSFSTKSDGGASIRFASNELSDTDFLILKKFHNSFGWLLFSESSIQPSDIPTNAPDTNTKSQAQRIRALLYKLHLQEGGKPEDFHLYYKEKTEKYINYLKSKLDT